MADSVLTDSILVTVRGMLGPSDTYTHFDRDIAVHINACLSILRQLGIGPMEGFRITGETETWEDFLGEDTKDLGMVVDYIYMKIKLIFDPPSSAALLSSYQELVKEVEWRACVEPEIRGI